MSLYQIERNVPVPAGGNKNPHAKYPWAHLGLGDSFFVPGKTAAQFSARTVYGNRSNPGKRFICRTVAGGCRVWRVQ